MMRLSKLTDYAVVMMVHMGQADGRVFSAAQISEETGVPAPTVATPEAALCARSTWVWIYMRRAECGQVPQREQCRAGRVP